MLLAVRAWCLPCSTPSDQCPLPDKPAPFAVVSRNFLVVLICHSYEVMVDQSRRHSPGSNLSFTKDAVRSSSRGGSGQGSSNSFQNRGRTAYAKLQPFVWR